MGRLEKLARKLCRDELEKKYFSNNPVLVAVAFEVLDAAVARDWRKYLPEAADKSLALSD